MHSYELEMLRREYENPVSQDDTLIQMELENIIRLNDACKGEEFRFANAIVEKFCQIIRRMKQQHEMDMNYQTFRLENESRLNQFMSVKPHLAAEDIPWAPSDPEEDAPYGSGEEILVAFYNRFRNEQKRRIEKEPERYPEISHIRQLREEGANPTMRDYVARVNTFANRYLFEVFPHTQVYERDPVLFIYENLELILGRFDTSDSKQKVNIRSALRKLNEFKQEQDSREFR